MDKPQEIDFNYLLFSGVIIMLMLALVVVVFVVMHQKRVHTLQLVLRQQELDHQTLLLKSVVASQESERERISQDLHDEIGASLSAAQLFINQIKYETSDAALQTMAAQASQIVGDTLQSVRHIVQNMSLVILEKFGFCRALTQLGSRLAASDMQVEMQVDKTVEALDGTVQLTLYRIIQEIFTNATKHAQARHLTLHLQSPIFALRQ